MRLGCVWWMPNARPGADPVVSRLERAAELGLRVFNVWFLDPAQRTPEYLGSLAEAAARHGVELRLTVPGRFGSADPEERKADVAGVIAQVLEANRHAGIRFSALANWPMSHTRWAPDPPMDERIGIIAESLAQVADGVAPAGVTLGVENHCDYRGYEIAAMLERANRPNLKAQLDTGNAFTVFEDPVDCARALAKWTASVHLKDVRVTPFVPAGPCAGIRGESVPLGAGQVGNAAICRILREQAPDAGNLALIVEPLCQSEPPEAEGVLMTSLDWARSYLAEYL